MLPLGFCRSFSATFVERIARTVSVYPTDDWVFIVDNRDTHASESLVEWRNFKTRTVHWRRAYLWPSDLDVSSLHQP